MQLAYLISAHTDAPQLQRLIQALAGDAHFFIHLDAKADAAPFLALCQGPNVHFLEERVDVRWATFLQVDYQQLLLRAALAYPVRFHRLIMLSGLDYPVRSNAFIRAWIAQQGERETLSAYCLQSPELPAQQRRLYATPRPLFRCLPTKLATKLSILIRRAMEAVGYERKLEVKVNGERWPLYKGSSWFCISEGLAQYVVDTYNQHPILRRYFQHTFGPDETMIPTIVMNAPQWAPLCTLVQGSYPGLAALTPIHYILYEPVVQVMTTDHIDLLRQSGKLFARKFVSGPSDALVAQLPLESGR